MSIWLCFGSRKATASSAGTSTPSENTLTLQIIRAWSRLGASFSQRRSLLRLSAVLPPSRWRDSRSARLPRPASTRVTRPLRATLRLIVSVNHLERWIVEAKAMLRASEPGRSPPSTAPFSASIVPSSRHRSVSDARFGTLLPRSAARMPGVSCPSRMPSTITR